MPATEFNNGLIGTAITKITVRCGHQGARRGQGVAGMLSRGQSTQRCVQKEISV